MCLHCMHIAHAFHSQWLWRFYTSCYQLACNTVAWYVPITNQLIRSINFNVKALKHTSLWSPSFTVFNCTNIDFCIIQKSNEFIFSTTSQQASDKCNRSIFNWGNSNESIDVHLFMSNCQYTRRSSYMFECWLISQCRNGVYIGITAGRLFRPVSIVLKPNGCFKKTASIEHTTTIAKDLLRIRE